MPSPIALNPPVTSDGSSILWVEELEKGCSDDPGAEVSQKINPDVRPCREAHDRNAHRDCRVEGCAGNTADSKGAGHDRESNGKAVEGVARVGLGGSNVEDDRNWSECGQKFGQKREGNVKD